MAVFLTECYILPKISASSWFHKSNLFKKFRENVTVINKTEQVVIREDASINKIASQAAVSVVNIISIPEKIEKIPQVKDPTMNGTGFFATSDGMVVTYRKTVIESNASYKILTQNGSSYSADLLGIDEFSNLAYFKIDSSNFPTISFSNSGDSFPGKKLIAIGNSFEEYQNRFAAGLLSNINKTFNISGMALSMAEKMEGVFETDFGNLKEYLGGPVIDYNGELVGVMGSATSDGQEKYFVIPSNMVKKSIEFAMQKNFGQRPVLGIYYLPITKAYSIANNLNLDRGALVYSPSGKQELAIISGSPAEKAGIRINDVIIAVNRQEVNLDNPLSNSLNQYKKGDSVEFLVIREGKEIKIPVQL